MTTLVGYIHGARSRSRGRGVGDSRSCVSHTTSVLGRNALTSDSIWVVVMTSAVAVMVLVLGALGRCRHGGPIGGKQSGGPMMHVLDGLG